MANAAMSPMSMPSGGLASFLTSNMDEVDDSVLAFGRGDGINSMRDVAERMAQMGRNGDNYVVHASEREMIVPREVVERNPELRKQSCAASKPKVRIRTPTLLAVMQTRLTQ
jgi:hypothetical protein